MTNTKFTPGPWNNEKPNGGETLARVWHVREGDKGIMRTLLIQSPLFRGLVGEGEANAHLIAAAPELYAALKEVEWQTKIVDGTLVLACPRCTSIDGDHFPGCQLDAALRKARGEWSADDILKREG